MILSAPSRWEFLTEDGEKLTWDRLEAKYKGTYTEQELTDYWDREMKPVKASAKAKL